MDNLYGGIGTTRVRRDISVGQHGTCYRRVVTHPGDITQELKVIHSEVTCDIFGALALEEVVLLNRRKYILFWKRTLGGRVGGGRMERNSTTVHTVHHTTSQLHTVHTVHHTTSQLHTVHMVHHNTYLTEAHIYKFHTLTNFTTQYVYKSLQVYS